MDNLIFKNKILEKGIINKIKLDDGNGKQLMEPCAISVPCTKEKNVDDCGMTPTMHYTSKYWLIGSNTYYYLYILVNISIN